MYYIGIDLGTSAVKLLLMEESGKICNIVSREYPLFFPHPGWSEQKPEDWFAQSMEGMKELTKDIDRATGRDRFVLFRILFHYLLILAACEHGHERRQQ